MKRLRGFASLLLLGWLLVPPSLIAQQSTALYVNRTDPTCGGQSPCFATIQAAIDVAQPRTTIRIQAGTYPEQLTIQKNDFAGAVEADRIIIESDPSAQPGQVVITGSPGPQCTDKFAVRIKQSKFVTIRDLTFTGTGAQAISMMGGNNGNVGIHIELNRIFGNGSSSCNGGITVARNNPGTLIANNLIYGNGRNGIAFIDADGGPHYIINNTIVSNQWNGIDVPRNHQIVIANNIVNKNGTASGTTGGRFGVRRESSSSPNRQGIQLLNNLVCGNTQGEINGPVLDDTDSSNYTPTGSEGPGTMARPGCESETNLFANRNSNDNQSNTADDDFSLKQNSLAIDVGMDPRTLGLDLAFNSMFESDFIRETIRPADGNADRVVAFDAGAYEYANAPPVANAGAPQTAFRGQSVTLNGTGSSDPEGAPLTYQWSIISQPSGSDSILSGANTVAPIFMPLFLGDYNVQLIVTDGQFSSAPASVRVTVINRAPSAEDGSVTVNEDTPVTITANASDADDPSLTFSIVTGPSNGTLGSIAAPNCVANGIGSTCTATVPYTPNSNFSGSDSFSFKVNDGNFDSNIATISISVNTVNDPPVANATAASTNEDTSVDITLSASDVDNAGLTFAVVAGPTNGSLGALSSPNCVPSGNGSSCTATITYTPRPDFNGRDSFTFKVNDASADSTTANVSITVNAVNDGPVAQGQSVATSEDTPVVVTLTTSDVDSAALSFAIVSGPARGSLGSLSTPNCIATGAGANCMATVTYTPGANISGLDSFTFKVNDGSLDSNVATVSITVNLINDAAVAVNDFYNTGKDTVLSIGAPGVLGNDNDLDSQSSSLTAVLVSAPSNAANFTFNVDGSFVYTPNTNFTGTDSFTYKTNDGTNDSNAATVTIAVLQANNAPIATNDFYNTEKDTALSILTPGVLANDSDLDTPLAGRMAILIAGPSHAASFTLNPDGSFDYTPTASFTGADGFTYKVNDGTSDSSVAMVTIAVIAPNTFPVAKNDIESTNEDAARTVSAPGVLGNDSIALLTTPTAVLVSGPTRALSFALNADGSFNYTPQNEFTGADGFTYRIYDGTKYSNVAMVNIDVIAVNDVPVAQSQSVSTNENTPVIITLSASDIDSQTLSFNIATAPSHGSLGNVGTPNCTVQGQGATCTATVSYTPAGNDFGPDTFTFTATDGQATSAPATVSITVIQINHSPTANAGGPYTGSVGVPVQFNGSGNDPDGNPITFSWTYGDGGTGSGANPTYTYSAPGAYTVTLTVTDSFGASGISQTTATINPAVVLNPIGNKTVNLGETLTLTVSATSGSGSPISLYVAPLPLMTNATFNASTGVFTFRPTTTQVGSYPLTFSATSGTNSASETITITVPNPPPGGTTSVRGRVVNLAQTPLGNVRVTVKSSGHTALSSSDGFFTITGTPSGTQQLIVNGRDANLGVYAILAVAVELINGVLNDLASPISLPDVDVEAEVPVSSTFNTVVTNASLPGVEVEIIGGSATNPDGTLFTGKLSINPVPDYGRPESRPEELRPGMAVTIQPAGIRFNPPARITFPNADGMTPGNELNLWSLSPDTGKFNVVGKMAVSADGQTFITVEGGVVASAWHFPLASSSTPVANEGNNFCGSCRTPVGSEANLEEGSLYQTYSLPSYRSLGQSRSVSLTYSSVTADPKPIISADTTLSARAAVPGTFSTRLKIGGVQQGDEAFTNAGSLPESLDSNSRLSHQFDASNLITGRYSYELTVFSNYPNSSIGGIANGNTIVVNRKNSPFGAGWALTEIQQIHPQSGGGVLLTGGDGTALFFSGGPDSFASPARDFSTLIRNPDGTYTRSFKDGTKINFNSQGLQTSVVDRNNNTTAYGYDGSGRLITITDPVGLVTTLSYANGSLQRITDPAGRQTQFQHDSAGNVTRITNPDSTFVSYAYDAIGRMTRATDELGNSTTYGYDFAGRFAQSTRPGGETRSLVSAKLQGLPNAGIGQGSPTNPAPIVTSENASVSSTDGRGNSHFFTLDSLGQVISQRDALGQVTTIQRDANGLPTRIVRPNNAMTTMTYDSKGNLLTTTDPMGATTTFTYEPTFNQAKTIRDPKGNTTTINYDIKGNPIEIVDALNNRTQMTYDTRGLLTVITSAIGTPAQNTTSFAYDARGNLFTTTNPKGDVTTLVYDNTGNVSNSTDAENRVTQFTYDPRNRLITVLDADLNTTQYAYDPKGNLAQVRDTKNQLTTFAYDGLDRLASATNPLGLTETFIYDGNGNLTSTTNRNSQTIAFNYDAINRLTSKTRPPASTEVGNQVTTFSYDSVGNLTNVTNPTIGVFNQYDAANRLISSTSTTESSLSSTVVPVNVDTTIAANNFQFEGRTLQVNGQTLTVNGQHTFANIVLLNGAVLTHSPTTGTTQGKLDILVTGTIQIDNTSRIDVSGRGFLGGGQPGNPSSTNGMTVGFQATNQSGTAGSYGGLGGNFSGSTNPVYGDFRNPNEVGSGGGGFQGAPAGNGGGLVRIVAQSIMLNGAIRANGGVATSFSSGGSGGGIRIDAGTLSGTGPITADGSSGTPSGGGGGGGGRVAIYYQTSPQFNFSNVTATGGIGSGAPNGGAGSVYLQGSGRENGELIIDNNNVTVPVASTTPILGASTATLSLSHLRVRRSARAKLDSSLNLTGTVEVGTGGEFVAGNPISVNAVSLTGGGVLAHASTTGSVAFKLDITAQSLSIDATSRIDVTGRGFLGGGQPGNPSSTNGMTVGFQATNQSGTAGSYGGLGGNFSGSTNPVYGDFRNPNEVGSGGGGFQGAPAGNGGGLVRIVAQSVVLNGAIRGNGGPAADFSAGGSGGGLRIDVGTISGTGSINANGSAASPSSGGGGGSGGRIAIYYQDGTGFNFGNVTAFGATFSGGSINGGPGSVYLQGPSKESGELIIDNNNLTIPVASRTPILGAPTTTLSLTHLRLRRSARAKFDGTLNLTGTLEISNSSEFLSGARIISDTTSLTSNSVLTHAATTGTASFKLDLTAESLTIDGTSRIDVIGLGFLGGGRPGNPSSTNGMTLGFNAVNGSGTAGSYGGLGGAFSGSTNPLYGTATNPKEVGSGGGGFNGSPAGNGGGLAKIAVQTFILNGAVRANGGIAEGFSAGGSGGGIRIDVGTLSGSGSISANGSSGTQSGGGGGGGGRVAVYYGNATAFNLSNMTALGGTGSGAPNGQNGTIHVQQQIANLSPLDQAPVIKAEADINPTIRESVRLAFADVPPRHVFMLSDQSAIQKPKSKIHENLYIAMVAEGNLKPFASMLVSSDGTGVSEFSPSVFSNPRPKIENPKLEQDTRASDIVTTHSSPLTPDDLDPIYTYDLNGNRVSMIDPTGLTTYGYDALNRLTSITNNKGQVTSFTYDALSRRTSMTHANGVVTTYQYDSASQLTRLAHQLGATTINSFDYTYDKVGNRKSKSSRDGMHDYTYDTLNRLIQATNPLPSNPLEMYNYDPVGNRTNSNQNGSSVFNAANELNEDANFIYEYDNNGNMTRKTAKVGGATTTYEYDAENKLVRVVSPSNTANYKYDGLGRRVEKEVIAGSTTVTKYVYDNEDILLEVNGSNAIVARYTHGPGIDEPLIMEKNSQSFFYHPDGLGSITEMTNQSGAVVQRYTYSSFGKIESRLDANFVQLYTFTSREEDIESGLYYYRARTYDFSIGRFLQQDPVGITGDLNLYSYLDSNPAGSIDPFGLDAVDSAANVAAGLGDAISLGLTSWLRNKMEINDVIDECSWSYSAGKWAGWLHGIAMGGAGSLNAGARTVLYGGEGALDAARLGKGAGILLEDTLGGQFLNFVNRNVVTLRDGVWKASSGIFASNAKGQVAIFSRNPNAKSILNTVEIPALNIMNRINSSSVTSIILR
ncbi:MAG TPA: tandem-95 repeat protein [Candidatus Binatia bacterium]|nr:tandem-95 repeat protein [Candidatus Binatia bacterium]